MRASITVDPYRVTGEIDSNIYGQFLSRRRGVVDGGLYHPEHPDADESGLRKKVVDAIAESGPPIVRWPGGCTGTSYHWKDGIGPQEERERTIDVHFGYDVSNGFGTAEFVEFCRRIGAEPHFNLNTGLDTLKDAVEWLEYTNFTTPSRWANLRRKHGYEEPFNVRYWQIGNENYGPWEVGHQSPAEYGTMAGEWAKTMKKMGPELKIIAVGGSDHNLDWDPIVLDAAFKHIDYLTTQISESKIAQSIRTHRWKYGVSAAEAGYSQPRSGRFTESHLYDLENDPYELDNLIGHPAVRERCDRLKRRLITRMVEVGETTPIIHSVETQGRGQHTLTEAELTA